MAHGVIAAATSAAGDHNALTAAINAGGAEAAAPYVSRWLYGEKDGSKLTSEQKQTVSSILSFGGAAVGVTNGSAADVVAGGQAAQTAVENNYHLRIGQRQVMKSELNACKGNLSCELEVGNKWENTAIKNQKDLYAACDKGINTSACVNLRNKIDTSTYNGWKDYTYPTGMQLSGEAGGMIGLGPQINGKLNLSIGNRGISAQAEGGFGLGVGVTAYISKEDKKGITPNESTEISASTEYIIRSKSMGEKAKDENATLGTKLDVEGKLGPLNASASVYGGRQYPKDETSSLYKGAEAKASIKSQVGVGAGIKWDIINGRTEKYEKIK